MSSSSKLQPVAGQFYTVAPEDNLAKISATAYGREDKWETIYQVNKSKIGENPNQLEVGMIIAIPDTPSEG